MLRNKQEKKIYARLLVVMQKNNKKAQQVLEKSRWVT